MMRIDALMRIILGFIALGSLLLTANLSNAGTCPNPLPGCTSSGTLADFTGNFGCTAVTTNVPNGGFAPVKASVLLISPDGKGNFAGKEAQNSNDPSVSNTYQDFTTVGGMYCVNTDDTGYLFPTGGCPIAFVIDSGKQELRGIDSSEQRAGAMTCREQ
ncbi:MAG TPA: hypothetical protein VEF03_06890 [Candidatus Binataceae bacterium]|nr:hypothetical protein [Candidatus Binataceae bacterium]